MKRELECKRKTEIERGERKRCREGEREFVCLVGWLVS